MRDALIGAIQAKRVVEFVYEADIRRVGEPHTLGYQAGSLILEMWQTSLASHSAPGKPGFRSFTVDDMSALAVRDETFSSPRPGYNPNNSRWESKLARVS